MVIATFRYYNDKVIDLTIHGNVVKSNELQQMEKDTEKDARSSIRPSLGDVLAALTSHGFEILFPPLEIVSGPLDITMVSRPEYKFVLGCKNI